MFQKKFADVVELRHGADISPTPCNIPGRIKLFTGEHIVDRVDNGVLHSAIFRSCATVKQYFHARFQCVLTFKVDAAIRPERLG